MFNWKMLILMALPMLEAAGYAKINEDDNDTGKDDIIGQSMLYAAKLLRAIVLDQTLPKAPEALR